MAVTPASRGKGRAISDSIKTQESTIKERHKNMTWAERLKRVFGIDISTCIRCGGPVKIVACIENPIIIKKILDYLDAKVVAPSPFQLPLSRASPQLGLF